MPAGARNFAADWVAMAQSIAEARDGWTALMIGASNADIAVTGAQAARARGLGTALTTVVRIYGRQLLAELGVPPDRFEIAALVPVGYPSGTFGVAPRRPAWKATHWDRWGERRQPGAP